MPANTPPIEELERALSDEKLSGFGRRAEKLLWEHRHELLSLAKLALLVREGGEEMAIERAIGQEQIDRLTSIIRDLVEAIDAPRSGDDSIWDDLLNFGMHEGGPLGRARDFLRTLETLAHG